jgi:hypothetical protein
VASRRTSGYRLIDAARVAEVVSTTVDTAPANEAQARELVSLLAAEAELAGAVPVGTNSATCAAWISRVARVFENDQRSRQ